MIRKLHFPDVLSLYTVKSICFHKSSHCYQHGMQRYLLLRSSVTCSFCREIVSNHLKKTGFVAPLF